MPQIATAKALREERFELAKTIRQMADKINDEKRDFTAEEQVQWDKVNADYDGYAPRIAAAERAESVDADQNTRTDTLPGRENTGKPDNGDGTPPCTAEHRALALQAWCRANDSRGLQLKKRHVNAIKIYNANAPKGYKINLQSREIPFKLLSTNEYRQMPAARREKRAQSVYAGTGGMYTVPEGFVNDLEIAELAYCPIREFADVMRTDTGNDLPWPTVNDTTQKGSILAENTTVAEKDVTFGQILFHAFKYTTGMVQVPVELLEDSAFELAAYLANLFGIRLGRIAADHFTFGTGAGQPTGFITAGTSGLTFASSTAIAADEIYSLKHSVDPAYRPGAIFMMHDATFKYIKTLKDGAGRYLWQSGLAASAPDTLDGDPIVINQSMDQIATTKKTLAYGDFSKYKIRDVNQIRMRRLVERYADSDQEGFVAFQRWDGNLLDAGTHPIKFGTHP